MVILLEFIFQGFFEWIYSLILEIWNFFFASLLDIMTLDFAYIKAHVPVVEDIMEVFLAVGWALLLGNLVFQATRSMVSGLGFEGEDPKLLFARTFVFSFLLLACPQLCEIGLNLTSKIMTLLDVPDAINVHLVDGSIFGALTAAWLLVIIFDIILMFMVLKLLMEVAERYVILAVLTITAPLAFSMGGSKNTADIFAGWCRMFGSMCLLMVTNVMFFKMLLSVVSTVPSGLDVFPWMVLNVSIVKVAKKADEIITRIGLNPAITGDKGKGFGSALIYTVFRSAATKAVKVIGAAATGGASAAAGAAAGGAKAAAGAAGAAGAKGAAGAAGGFFRFGRQWGGAQLRANRQEVLRRTHPMEAARDPQTKLERGLSVNPARARSTKQEKAPSVSPDSRAALPESPLFRRAPGVGPRTSPAPQKPPTLNLETLPAAAAGGPADSAWAADLAAAPDAKPFGTPAEREGPSVLDRGAVSMCMSVMISAMGASVWAGIPPRRARPGARPPAASGEASIPTPKEPHRPQNPHTGKAVSGVGAALPPRAPASREAAPSGHRKLARPAEDHRPCRPHREEAILPPQEALPQRRRIPL